MGKNIGKSIKDVAMKGAIFDMLLGGVCRVRSLFLRRKIMTRLISDKTLQCGPNATVFNHGLKKNIHVGAYVILDGILECYEHGQLYIDDYSYIGRSRLFAAHSIKIGKGVLISDNVVIMDSDLHPLSAQKRFNVMVAWSKGLFPDVYTDIEGQPVCLGDFAWIGANSVILKGVTIGEGAIVGAGSVVTKDVPSWTIVAGNPATIIREIPPGER